MVDEAFQKGYDAWPNIDLCENPYHSGRKWEDWDQGWKKAHWEKYRMTPASVPDCMTLRDYFAAHAMRMVTDQGMVTTGDTWPASVANMCYELADAMINERDRDASQGGS